MNDWTDLSQLIHRPDGRIELHGVLGYLLPQDAAFLQQQARFVKPGGQIIEVGSYLGLSAIIMAAANPSVTIHCIDTWTGSPEMLIRDTSQAVFHDNCLRAGVADRIVEHRGYSATMTFAFPLESVDLVFIDGDHSYRGVLDDLVSYWILLKHGGTMIGHDATPGSSVRRALLTYCEVQGRIPSFIPDTYGMWQLHKP